MIKRLNESIDVKDVIDFDILQLLKSEVTGTYGDLDGRYVSELNQYINDRFMEDEYLKAAKFYSDLFDVYEAKYGYFGDHDYLILPAGKNIEEYVREANQLNYIDVSDVDEEDLLKVSDFRKIS